MNRRIIRLSVLAALGIFVLGVLFYFCMRQDDKLVVKEFSIEKGESTWEISGNLKKERLIKQRISFVLAVYRKNLQNKIKAGEYSLNSELSNQDIIEIITKGDIIEENKSVKITFPEGWSTKLIAARLDKNGFSGDKFLSLTDDPSYFLENYEFNFLSSIPSGKNLEGFLFPDTYFFNSDMEDEETVIKKMLENFDEKLSKDLRKEIETQGKTIYQIVTMASILEEEVRTQEDRKIVSGIFWNRLKSGQAFQSCATLAFVLGENKKQYSYKDTRVESLYNTYLYPGLPPGPISNPGLEAIEAAIYPTDTNYNYFLNNPETGETVFSSTLEEHNANKVKNGL